MSSGLAKCLPGMPLASRPSSSSRIPASLPSEIEIVRGPLRGIGTTYRVQNRQVSEIWPRQGDLRQCVPVAGGGGVLLSKQGSEAGSALPEPPGNG